ncbi:MAG: porin family protein [Bacteroidales bacterium]
MKRKFALLLLITLASMNLKSQRSNFSIGVDAGISRSSLRTDKTLLPENRTSHSEGISIDYQLLKYFSLKSGLYLENKGDIFKIDITDEAGIPLYSIKNRINFTYLTIPLLCSFSTTGTTKLFFNIGSSLGMLQNATQRFDGLEDQNGEINIYDTMRKIDIGLISGIGVNHSITKTISLNFEIRDNYGLLNSKAITAVNAGSSKHNILSALLGVRFKI